MSAARFARTALRLALVATGVVGGLLLLALVFGSPRAFAADASASSQSDGPMPATGSSSAPSGLARNATGPVAGLTGSATQPVAAVVRGEIEPVAARAGSATEPVVAAAGSAIQPVAALVGSVAAPATGLVGQVASTSAAAVTPVLSSVGSAVTGVVGSLPSVNVPPISISPTGPGGGGGSGGSARPGGGSSATPGESGPAGDGVTSTAVLPGSDGGALADCARGFVDVAVSSPSVTSMDRAGNSAPGTPSGPPDSPGPGFAVLPGTQAGGSSGAGSGVPVPAEVTSDRVLGAPAVALSSLTSSDEAAPSPVFGHDTTPD